jgi:hypothetical protein
VHPSKLKRDWKPPDAAASDSPKPVPRRIHQAKIKLGRDAEGEKPAWRSLLLALCE